MEHWPYTRGGSPSARNRPAIVLLWNHRDAMESAEVDQQVKSLGSSSIASTSLWFPPLRTNLFRLFVLSLQQLELKDGNVTSEYEERSYCNLLLSHPLHVRVTWPFVHASSDTLAKSASWTSMDLHYYALIDRGPKWPFLKLTDLDENSGIVSGPTVELSHKWILNDSFCHVCLFAVHPV
jgi:hypothetical protein